MTSYIPEPLHIVFFLPPSPFPRISYFRFIAFYDGATRPSGQNDLKILFQPSNFPRLLERKEKMLTIINILRLKVALKFII